MKMLTAKNNQGHLNKKQSYRFIPPNINIYYKVKILEMVKWPEGRQIEDKSRKCVTKIPLIQREKTVLSISGAGSVEYQYQVSTMM